MASKPIYYWDACMFYEWLGAEPVSSTKRDAVQEILEDNKKKDNHIFTSVISHLEVLPKKLSEKHFHDDQAYLDLFDGVHFSQQEVGLNVLMRAREIRDFYYRPADPENGIKAKMMDAGDAIHLATASIYGCNEFHTRDDDDKGVKIPLLRLYSLSGSNLLCGKYQLKIVSPETAQTVLNFVTAQQSP